MSGFLAFDEGLTDARPDCVVVRSRAELREAVLHHAARRLEAAGVTALLASFRPAAPLFVEIAERLGLALPTTRAEDVAAAIAEAHRRTRFAILGALPAEGSWDAAVMRALVTEKAVTQIFVTVDGGAPEGAEVFEVASFDGDDRARWMAAVATALERQLGDRPLDELDRLHRLSVTVPEPSRPPRRLDEAERAVVVRVMLAERPMPVHDEALVGALVAAGVLARVGANVVRGAQPIAPLHPTAAERIDVAECLLAMPASPWSLARAAELLALGGVEDEDRIDALVVRALRSADDLLIVRALDRRWNETLATLSGDRALALSLRAAARALDAGDGNAAEEWCRALVTRAPGDLDVVLLSGAAAIERGDLALARAAFERVFGASDEPGVRARALAGLAEIAYQSGDLDAATMRAQQAFELATLPRTRLEARNVIGKVLLARAQWDAADAHFVEDVLVAAESQEPTADLRARLNRTIALLSSGRLGVARTLLEQVFDDASAQRNTRAQSFALRNLAVIAYRQHEYGRALSLWDEDLRICSAIGARTTTAFMLANFGDLRLRLGLVDHAAHTVAFGRRLLSGHAPRKLANLGIVAARVALARGDTVTARREFETARRHAEEAGDEGDRLPDALLCGARIALEDGDAERANELLERATKLATTDRLRAEVALVRAHSLRATGESPLAALDDAIGFARASDEVDVLAEVHGLYAQVACGAGDLAIARTHCRWAIASRDGVAASLPPEIRAAFLSKPENLALSRLAATLAEEAPSIDRVAEQPRQAAARAPTATTIIGDSAPMRGLLTVVRRVARTRATVLVHGESGTGKELVAAAIHRESERAGAPFVTVNCAALVETLLLSELFGHEKGAFTGATGRKQGRFEIANGGTLFLDEIGDISPKTQVALLRVLQEKTFERVGGTTSLSVDVRVVCATHRDLGAMVARGEFREDLYYRLQGVTLEVPPLRDRMGDLAKLAEHVLALAAVERDDAPRTLSSDARTLLMRYRWPGNVRELENVLRAVSIFAEGPVVTVGDLVDHFPALRAIAQSMAPMRMPPSEPPPSPETRLHDSPLAEEPRAVRVSAAEGTSAAEAAYTAVRDRAISLSRLKREIERECLARALEDTGGNITHAAALLGMKRPRLSQLAKQYRLKANSSDSEKE